MSFIVTADVQCDFQNIDLCQQAWDQILCLCKKYKLGYIIVNGDAKHVYNPIDARVAIWWQRAIRRAIKLGIKVIFVLGNHDRIGQYTQANNWFPILRRAGAITYDKPGVFDTGEERLFILPWDTPANVKTNAKELLKYKPDKKKDVLLFHQDIQGAKYNNLGGKSDVKLSIDDLYIDRYSCVVAGHIHLPQCIKEKVYYVGSPFCTDWGECNQQKRYLIVRRNKLVSIDSAIPGWYDPSVNDFQRSKPKTWEGTRVRITVECNASEDYGRLLERARKRAERKYKGSTIFVVPKFKNVERDNGISIRSTDTDEKKIREYVKQSNGELVAVDYMLKVLSQCEGSMRQALSMKFLSMKAKNFLSYRELDVDLTQKGITLIQGINEDRGGKSNGSGKTSLLQPIPVALFGKTFKDQKHDSWASRWTKDESYVKLKFKNHKGQTIQVKRGRRPPILQMKEDGKDISSGMKSNDKQGTQAQIEQAAGFTWQTLANAVYIDRMVSNAFLSGTKSQRTEVLSRFQQLERFERALKLVKKDISTNEKAVGDLHEKLYGVRTAIKHTIRSIADLKHVATSQLRELKKKWKQAYRIAYRTKSYNVWKYKKALVSARKELKKVSIQYDGYLKAEYRAHHTYLDAVVRWRKIETIQEKDTCPTCNQPVDSKWMKTFFKTERQDVSEKESKWLYLKKGLKKHSIAKDAAEQLCEKYEDQLSEANNKERERKLEAKQLQRQYEELQTRQSSVPVSKAKSRLKKLTRKKQQLKSKLKHYRKQNKVYQYAAEAFSRDGIPAFLNAQLCPVLNKAASYYAEAFSSSELQVRFLVEEGELVPQVINPRGGESIDDQSSGEKAIAGLISSFALREVAPRCNLLILDEPGEGLDSQTARQFARSLQKLKKRFGAIWICTHNKEILSELDGERTITVRKHNRVSRLEVA